jgi:acyl-CoA thioester hydrolase
MKKFALEMDVRDNELDAQGIVNNANYMIYLSHARHKHGELLGINHTDFAGKNLNLVITSCTMKFRNSLTANDRFSVSSEISSGDLPFHWAHKQEIKRLSDGKIVLKAVFNATCVDNNKEDNKLFIPETILSLIE